MSERFNLLAFAYAHRGLWRPDGPPENSVVAFAQAAAAGFGAELDVRPARCGVPVVFHDPLLDRTAEASGLVAAHDAAELSQIALRGGGCVPTFDDVLDAWPPATPLLCELKIDGATDAAAFAARVGDHLNAHGGPAAAMSFSEAAVAALPAGLQRGQLIEPARMTGPERFAAKLSRALDRAVDYLAVHVTDLSAALDQSDENAPVAVWTVSDAAALSAARAAGAAPIFEHIAP